MKNIIKNFKYLSLKMKRQVEVSYSKNYYHTYKEYDVVIHIGAPKTGSSAIQKFLLENRHSFESIGFYYPIHGLDQNGVSGGHSNIGLSIINNNIEDGKKIFEEYMSYAKENNLTLLLSAESFFNHHEKLYQIVKGYKCKIIVFYREPMEAIFSNYNQSVKRHFNTSHIDKVCENALKNNNAIVSGMIYGKWIELFGRKNVTILEYNLHFFKKHSIQEVFLKSLELDQNFIDNIKPKGFEQVNKSYALAELEFKRVLNHVLSKENILQNNEIDWALQMLTDLKNEPRTVMDEVSEELYQKLYEKLKFTRIRLLEYGMVCFAMNDKPEFSSKQNKYAYKNKVNDILEIVEYFKNNKRDIFDYMVSSIVMHINTIQPISYDIIKLAEWFDVQFNRTILKDIWFTKNQLNAIANGKYKQVDFLKNIAILLLKRGDIENADKIISKALELIPNGSEIIKIKNSIEKLK